MNLFKNIGNAVKKAAKDTAKATVKAAVDTGHVAGADATSKVGQLALGGALALTGVGLPAAAAIGAGVKGGGNLIKKGGNLRSAVVGVEQGAVLGAGAAVAGSAVRAVRDNTGLGGFKNTLLKGKAGEAESIAARDKQTAEKAARIPANHPLEKRERTTVKPRNNPTPMIDGAPKAPEPTVLDATESGITKPKSPGLMPAITPTPAPKKQRTGTPSSTMTAIGQLKDDLANLKQSANSPSGMPVPDSSPSPSASSPSESGKNNTILLAAAAGVVLLVVMMNKKG